MDLQEAVILCRGGIAYRIRTDVQTEKIFFLVFHIDKLLSFGYTDNAV